MNHDDPWDLGDDRPDFGSDTDPDKQVQLSDLPAHLQPLVIVMMAKPQDEQPPDDAADLLGGRPGVIA